VTVRRRDVQRCRDGSRSGESLSKMAGGAPVDRLAARSSASQYRNYRHAQRAMLLKTFEEKTQHARVTYEELRDHFDRQQAGRPPTALIAAAPKGGKLWQSMRIRSSVDRSSATGCFVLCMSARTGRASAATFLASVGMLSGCRMVTLRLFALRFLVARVRSYRARRPASRSSLVLDTASRTPIDSPRWPTRP
jgi:hypothetical protein